MAMETRALGTRLTGILADIQDVGESSLGYLLGLK